MVSYYTEIDELPLKNWLKISYGLIKYSRKNLNNGTKKQDEKYAEKLKDEYYEVFGISAEYLHLLELQQQLIKVRMDWVISGDNFLKNKIAMLEVEIEDLIGRKNGGDIGKTIISLSKWVGYRIDVNIITVKEFYSMIEMFKEEMQERKNKSTNGTGKDK